MLDPDLLLAREQSVAGQRAHVVAPARKPGVLSERRDPSDTSRHMPMESHRAGRRPLDGGERLWVLSQSANRAFGCHRRRCFAKQSVSDPVLTCCSLASPHRSRGHPRHDCGSAVSCRLAKWSFKNRANCAEASSEEVFCNGHWFNVSSAKNSGPTSPVADPTNPTVRVGWPTPSQQWTHKNHRSVRDAALC